jgi:hypothetical protein
VTSRPFFILYIPRLVLTFFFSLPLQSYSPLPLFRGEAGGSRLTIGCRLLVRIVQRANQQADSPKDVRKERIEWPGRGQGPTNVKTGATPTLTLHFQLGGIEFRTGEHRDKGTPVEPMNGQAEQKSGTPSSPDSSCAAMACHRITC